MVDLTQAHKASIELLGTRHNALVEAVRNYVNGSVQPSIDELIAAIEDVTTDIDTKEKMLLGLASRQAKKPVPSLILDFKTRHYLQGTRRPEKGYGIHDLLTVERATPKWVYSASGKLTEVPANEPAYQHDPVTGEPQGLLIEESRTNLLTWSEDFTQWSRASGRVESNVTGSPDGQTTGDKLVESDANELHYISTGVTLTAGSWTRSVYAKAGEHTSFSLARSTHGIPVAAFDIGNQAVLSFDGEDAGIEDAGNGWYRCWVSGTVSEEVSGSAHIFLLDGSGNTNSFQGDGTSGIYIWGAQYEEGTQPSSYIPTEDAPVTRAADSVYRTLSDEFNPVEGTVFVECYAEEIMQPVGSVFATSIVALGDSRGTNAITFLTTRGSRTDLQVTQYTGGPTMSFRRNEILSSSEGLIKLAFTYKSSGESSIAASGAVFTGTLNADGLYTEYNNPKFMLARLGNFNELNYTAPKYRFPVIRYYPRALTEQELIELTS